VSGEATAAAMEEAREQQERAAAEEDVTPLARLTGQQMTQGVLDALSQPETVAQMRRLVDALVSQSLRSLAGRGVPREANGPAVATGPGVGGGGPGIGGGAGTGQGPVSSLAADVARALALEMERQLGPDGTGPLAQSLSATAGQMASSIVQQTRNEFGMVFPECEGLQGAAARACVNARLSELGAAFTRGATEGVREALRPWLLLLAFAIGLLVGLLLFVALSLARANREEGRRTGLLRQRRPA
jgi:hypothetical protein